MLPGDFPGRVAALPSALPAPHSGRGTCQPLPPPGSGDSSSRHSPLGPCHSRQRRAIGSAPALKPAMPRLWGHSPGPQVLNFPCRQEQPLSGNPRASHSLRSSSLSERIREKPALAPPQPPRDPGPLRGSWYVLQCLQPKLLLFSATPLPLGSWPAPALALCSCGHLLDAPLLLCVLGGVCPGSQGSGLISPVCAQSLPAFLRVAPAQGEPGGHCGAWVWSCSAAGQGSSMVRSSWAWASGRPGSGLLLSFPQRGRTCLSVGLLVSAKQDRAAASTHLMRMQVAALKSGNSRNVQEEFIDKGPIRQVGVQPAALRDGLWGRGSY